MKSLSYISAFVLAFVLVVSHVLAAPQATESRVGAGTEGTMRTGELGSMQLPTGMFEVDARGHPTMNAMCLVVSNYCMSMSDRSRVAEDGRTGGVLAARGVEEVNTGVQQVETDVQQVNTGLQEVGTGVQGVGVTQGEGSYGHGKHGHSHGKHSHNHGKHSHSHGGHGCH